MTTNCPNCNESVDEGVSYCPSCGTAMPSACPSCGEPLPADANFCRSCGQDLTQSEPQASSQADDAGSWRLSGDVFAKRVDGAALDGDGLLATLTRRQTIQIETGNRALLLEDGELVDELGPGKHTLDSLGQRIRELRTSHDLTVVLVKDHETTVQQQFDDLRTAGGRLVSATLELAVTIDDAQTFFTAMLADRGEMTTAAFNQELGRAVKNVVQTAIQAYDRDDLYGNLELKRELADDIEAECRPVLERNGLALVDLVSFDYDDDRDEIRERRTELEIEEEREDLRDKEATLERRDRERDTDDQVHQERQRVREESAEQVADHTLDKQSVEQDHELDDVQRRHRHTAEREDVEHTEEVKTHQTEGKVERRDLHHEQDMSEMEDLMDLKKDKDEHSLDMDEREQEIELDREEQEIDMEKERLEARDDVDAETLASLDDTGEEMADLAKMDKAEDLSAEQLDSLGAQKSDELAKARQEANSAEAERQRVEDQKEFREDMQDVMEGSMDRMERTTDKAMDSMGETASAAAEDTADNVIVSGDGGSDSGDTNIVQGGGGPPAGGAETVDDGPQKVVICPSCGSEEPYDNAFCMDCGEELPHAS